MTRLLSALLVSATLTAAPVGLVASAQEITEDDVKREVLEEIVASREDITERIRLVTERLPEITTSIEDANETFDQIIETLRSQAEMGNPDGRFVQQIDQLAEMARADASEARTAGYADFEEEFLAEADGFDEDRETAVQLYESLDRRIRAVEAQRQRIVFVIKLNRYKEARELVDEGLDILRDADSKLGEIEKNYIPDQEEIPQ